jgi:hypothetical protein
VCDHVVFVGAGTQEAFDVGFEFDRCALAAHRDVRIPELWVGQSGAVKSGVEG